MATAKLTYALEKKIGHDDNAVTNQDIASYKEDVGVKDENMKALVWRGANDVRVGALTL